MIHIEDLHKRYGRREALKGVDLAVAPGTILALLGPNGAGKSTLLKSLVGLLSPTRGRIAIDGIDLARRPREALGRVGFVPQRVGFPAHLSIREVLHFYARLKGLGLPQAKRAMHRVGLAGLGDRLVGELSGGTLQRLGLAQAILADPPLLVLDEPTVGLDPQVSDEFRALLNELNGEGTTVILTSHLLGEVERLAHEVAILVDGRLVAKDDVGHLLLASGLPSALWLQPTGAHDEARRLLGRAGVSTERAGDSLRLNLSPDNAYVALETLREGGIAVETIWTTTPSLEEVFRWVVEKERLA